MNTLQEQLTELGSFTGFHKNQFANPFDNEYVSRFILEARYGVAIHLFSVPAAFLIILLDWKMYTGQSNIWLTICLPVAIVNAILIVLPAFILKYNLPTLVRIYNNNLEKEKRKLNKEQRYCDNKLRSVVSDRVGNNINRSFFSFAKVGTT